MAKKVKVELKLQLPAGKATPAPPVGTALGPHGINLGAFVKEFNDKTAAMGDITIPIVMTIFEDRSYTFILKTPPASNLIMKAIGLAKGSANPLTTKVGKITAKQITEIAEKKMPDLNATTLAAAESIIRGTARSMGVEVID
jgi:large subunit ribosomal protein L11